MLKTNASEMYRLQIFILYSVCVYIYIYVAVYIHMYIKCVLFPYFCTEIVVPLEVYEKIAKFYSTHD